MRGVTNGVHKVVLLGGAEIGVVAGRPADLEKCGYARADDGASGELGFDDRETEAFGGGGGEQELAVLEAPAELGFGEAVKQMDRVREQRISAQEL